ncbi:MAG: ostA-like family protein [Pegethrix bostrychoides GSE-TBD4-15B]|jgi:lipopolysaccharide export system protein LptA|uniref:OstA-like family protein n=1 Tax=Pegethrix bostrychoides GSE-TBD4-15B TaxID=2839662 RepID=A0A951PDT8_9CYAN|nr:ostA-like family protein [Pegethrix bostrychoides GSE-TBD4-15B]
MPSASQHSTSTRFGFRLLSGLIAAAAIGGLAHSTSTAQAQVTSSQALTLRADVQEANSITGVITARGNVQINYPARKIQATSVQAQYYSREQRIVLQGDVYVLQDGNSLRGETVTYLIEEGRFLALPTGGQQVESIYLVQDAPPPEGASPPGEPPFNPKPEFKTPISPP